MGVFIFFTQAVSLQHAARALRGFAAQSHVLIGLFPTRNKCRESEAGRCGTSRLYVCPTSPLIGLAWPKRW